MSTTGPREPVTEKAYGGVGRCKCSFWFAVAHDIIGVFIMLVGVFGGLVIHDLFIYAGAIVIFLSLIWWVFWYSGNIDVPPEELEDDVGMIKVKNRGISGVVRRMSGRLSNGIRNSFRRNGASGQEDPAVSQPANVKNKPTPTAGQPQATEVSLSIIYENPSISSSEEPVRETLSV